MSFCFCTDQKDVAKNIYVVVDQELGGGELSLSVCPVVGNRPPTKKNIANPRGCAWGGREGAWFQVKLNHALRVYCSASSTHLHPIGLTDSRQCRVHLTWLTWPVMQATKVASIPVMVFFTPQFSYMIFIIHNFTINFITLFRKNDKMNTVLSCWQLQWENSHYSNCFCILEHWQIS